MHIKALLAYKATIPAFVCRPFIYKNTFHLQQSKGVGVYEALAYRTGPMRDKAMISHRADLQLHVTVTHVDV